LSIDFQTKSITNIATKKPSSKTQLTTNKQALSNPILAVPNPFGCAHPKISNLASSYH
jgi:hypothetical protein